MSKVTLNLESGINTKDRVVGVFGLGYVGLPLSLTFCRAGFRVVGFDIDPEKVTKLNKGQSYIQHIGSHHITQAVNGGLFRSTTDFSELVHCDALIVCVPTPLTANRDPDLSFVKNTANAIAPHIQKGQLFCLESTTYPGTTEEVVRPILETSGLQAGKDFYLAYSPEREDPGNKDFSTDTIPKLVGGYSRECTRVAVALYDSALSKVVPVQSCAVAEAAKLLENIYRSVNIALVNELKILLTRMNIDVWDVINAAKTKPFGFAAFYPGPGLGGHCIPIDPFYLSWRARQFGLNTRFIELAGEVNTAMPEYVIGRVAEALNEQGKPIRGSQVFVLGLSYKKDVDDLRESPSIALIELLQARGAHVRYNDPFFSTIPPMRDHHLDIKSQPINQETLCSADLVLIATNHSDYDYAEIGAHSRIIVDTRNAMATQQLCKATIWKA
jgi:UDP-N-acetyl-D-glucosamine dehydrogenase